MPPTCTIHKDHAHTHGPDCGHEAVPHGDHVDYIHGVPTEHVVHEDHSDHQHGPDCGHEAVPHGDHVDYIHDGHRHALHNGHWDEH